MKMGRNAVSEIIGAIILLAMAVSVFSIIYINVLSDEGPDTDAFVTIVGKMESYGTINNTVAFENQRGVILDPDTEIMLTISGEQKPPLKINDFWNIGDKFFPALGFGDLTGEVYANIVDKKTNSLVFWGNLRARFPPRGGIWHLNESNGDIAYDSYNDNDGIIEGDILRENDGFSSVANNYLNFSTNTDYSTGISGQHVYVDGSGLCIIDKITILAWLNPPPVGEISITNFSFDNRASDIKWIHISNHIFAFCYWVPGNPGNIRIQTVDLVTGVVIGTYDIEFVRGTNGFDPDFIHISGTVYAVVHRFTRDNGYITTMTIHNDGTIDENPLIARVPFHDDSYDAYQPNIICVSDITNVYAIVTSTGIDDGLGLLTTLEIPDNGLITEDDVISHWEFETTNGCSTPRIDKINENFYIIAYSSSSNGWVKTIRIDNDGTNSELIDYFEINRPCNETDLEYVSSNNDVKIYAIAYEGFINTIAVSKNDGSIITGSIDILVFNPEAIYGGQPDIVNTYHDNIFAIAHQGPSNYGYLTLIRIYEDGTIFDDIIDSTQITEYDNERMQPTIIHTYPSGYMYGVAYIGRAGEGYLTGISIDDGGGGIPGTDGYYGISKQGSFYLYVNSTSARVSINNIVLDARNKITVNEWNHVALTYDGLEICLYVNGVEISNYAYNEKINAEGDLYFGLGYTGCLDEIAVFDFALTLKEIEDLYYHPDFLDAFNKH